MLGWAGLSVGARGIPTPPLPGDRIQLWLGPVPVAHALCTGAQLPPARLSWPNHQSCGPGPECAGMGLATSQACLPVGAGPSVLGALPPHPSDNPGFHLSPMSLPGVRGLAM